MMKLLKRKTRKVFTKCVLLTATLVSTAVFADASTTNVSGFVRTQAAFSLGDKNPNNTALGLPDDPNFNLIRVWGILDVDYKNNFSDDSTINSVRLFTRWRANWDLTQTLGKDVGNYDAFPLAFKDDWTLARANTKKASAELWEGFVDVRANNTTTFKIGRQNIVWGEADALRLLDIVNPLDLTQHMFFDGGGEQFDHLRIPLWAVRVTHDFKQLPGYSLDAYLVPGDFVPTSLPARGAPFNQLPFPQNAPPTILGVPPFFIPGLRVEDDTNDWRGKAEGGIRLLGEVGGLKYTLNYINKIDSDGVTVFDRFDGATGQVVLRNQRARLNVYGASFNYAAEDIGAVIRGELTHTPNQRYAAASGVGLLKRDTTKFVLGFDRPTFVFPTDQAMSISLQWFQTQRQGSASDITILNAPADKSETNFSIFLSQPIMNGQLSFDFLGVIDTDHAYWSQPQIQYKPGNHWRFTAYGNFFSGSEKRAGRFGGLKYSNEIVLQAGYQF